MAGRLLTMPAGKKPVFGAGNLLRIFDPFEPGVWACIVGTFFAVAITVVILEFEADENPDFHNLSRPMVTRARPPSTFCL